MKKIFAAATILAVSALSANAADLPARTYTKAPPMMDPGYNWTGFYIGGFVGGAGTDRNAVSSEPVTAGGVFYNGTGVPNSYKLRSSVIGGGTIGYNWQSPGTSWVFGLEGEAGYMRLRRSVQDINAITAGFAFPDSIDSTRIGDWYGTITGRLGYSFSNVLVYGKGGVAFVDQRASFVDACNTGACGGGLLTLGRNRNEATWTAGGGIEWAFAGNWSVKGEYMYIDTRQTYSYSGIPAGSAAVFTSTHSDPGVHTGKVGLNYRWGGPVVARY